MSNRQAEAKLEALKASHEAQIAALDPEITPGLTKEERVVRFADAAEFCPWMTRAALSECHLGGMSPINAVWSYGTANKSLFASMPDCNKCPIVEVMDGRNIAGIPSLHKGITPAHLPRFAEVQQEAWGRYWREQGQ